MKHSNKFHFHTRALNIQLTFSSTLWLFCFSPLAFPSTTADSLLARLVYKFLDVCDSRWASLLCSFIVVLWKCKHYKRWRRGNMVIDQHSEKGHPSALETSKQTILYRFRNIHYIQKLWRQCYELNIHRNLLMDLWNIAGFSSILSIIMTKPFWIGFMPEKHADKSKISTY